MTGLADLARLVGEIAHGWRGLSQMSLARAHAYENDPNLDGLPPAWAEGEAWFQLYPELAVATGATRPQRPRNTAATAPAGPSIQSLKTAVLEKLADYEVYIDRLRKWDRESYTLFRRIGMYVLPDSWRDVSARELEPGLLDRLPGFGAVAVGMMAEHVPGQFPIRFLYFRRLDRPGADIERIGEGVVYRMHAVWDDAKDSRWNRRVGHGMGRDYAVHIAPDGAITALRMLRAERQTIRHKRDGSSSAVMHQRWGLPEVGDNAGREPVPFQIIRLFICAMNFWSLGAHASAIRVTATKGKTVIPFNVDLLSTPAFFSDREPVELHGKRRRIFHIVRPHVRQTRRGPIGIKAHFAGLRHFRWNGYQIDITVPGYDHKDVADFTYGSHEDVPAQEQEGGGFVELNEVADIVADAIGAPKLAEASP